MRVLVLLLITCSSLLAQQVSWKLYNEAALQAKDQRHYAEAEKAFQAAIKAGQAVAPASEQVLISMGNLASMYDADGKRDKCEETSREAIALAETAKDFENQAWLLGNLASYYWHWNRQEDSLATRNLQIDALNRRPGPPDESVLVAMRSQANMLGFLKRDSEAEDFLVRGLGIAGAVYGEAAPEYGRQALTVAEFYLNHGQPEKAGPLCSLALATMDTVQGEDKKSLAIYAMNLVYGYRRLEKWAVLDSLQSRILPALEATCEPRELADFIPILADSEKARKNYPAAEELYQRAVSLIEKSLGAGDPEVANKLSLLELFYIERKRFSDAETVCLREIAIYEKSGARSLEYALENYAQLLLQMHRETEAASFKEKAADLRKTLQDSGPRR